MAFLAIILILLVLVGLESPEHQYGKEVRKQIKQARRKERGW